MTNSAVNCIHPFSVEVKNPQTKKDLDRTMVYGLANGSFINVTMEPDKPVYLWSVGVENNTKKAGISLIKVYDFQARGINDVILVRDDSTIELYSMNSDQEFEILKQSSVSEGITGLDAGCVTFPGLNEFIISTYSGKVIGYCDQEELNKTELKKTKETPKDSDKKIKALRAEIDKLKQDLDALKAENAAEGNNNVVKFLKFCKLRTPTSILSKSHTKLLETLKMPHTQSTSTVNTQLRSSEFNL